MRSLVKSCLLLLPPFNHSLLFSFAQLPYSIDLWPCPQLRICSQYPCLIKSNKFRHRLSLPMRNSFSVPFPPPSEGVTGLKELAFLRDLAEQNSVKYGVDRMSDRDRSFAASSSGSAGASMMPVVKGSMMVLNQLSNLETTVGRFYINLPNRMIDLARFSLPYADPMGDGEWFGHNRTDCLH